MDIVTALSELTRLGEERSSRGHFKLHENDGYVRVCAGGFRAVCVSDDAPLCGFGPTTVPNITWVVNEFKQARPPSPTAMDKPERRLQAYIIREALSSGCDLVPVLGRGLPFEKLLFALDEVRLDSPDGDVIRCDLLAVGMTDDRCEPVVIELKWGRQLAQLERQLRRFTERIIEFHEPFEKLLGAALGLAGEVSARRVHHVIVWPEPVSVDDPRDSFVAARERTRRQLETANISAFTYRKLDGRGYAFEVEATAPRPAIDAGG